MTIALIACLILLSGGHLVLLDRRDRRDREERADLLLHIQAPEAAVAAQVQQRMPASPDPMPLSDEQLSELQERELLIERIENMHMNGILP